MNKNETLLIRTTLASNVEYLLEKISSYKEELKNESLDLFGDEHQEDELELKKPEKINQLEVLLKEKEFLGLYVTDNPVEQYTKFVSFIHEVSELDNIYLIIVDKIKKIFTRNKDMMFGLEISKEGDKVEGIIFPKNSLKLSPLLVEKELFWVMGKVSTPKKRKVEVQQEGDFDSEDGNQVQEFVELPKLIIDNLVPYNEGVIALFDGLDQKPSKQRLEVLSKIDYESIKNDPENFKKYIGSNHESSETERKGPKEVRVELLSALDKKKAVEIKQLLQEIGTEYNISVYVQLLNGEFKKAKTEYCVSEETYSKIQNLLK
ncbi:MAG: hypothetical protein ACRCXZ_04605 [Patescibacteria group bacterium]